MLKDGRVRTFGQWIEDEGILYSNSSYKPYFSYQLNEPGETPFDAWMAFGEFDGDMSRYSMYDTCRDCPMLLDCAEYLPICTHEAQASEMVSCYT